MQQRRFLKTFPTFRFKEFLEESRFLWGSVWKNRRMAGWGILFLILVDFLEVLPPFLMKEAIDLVSEVAQTGELSKKKLFELAALYMGVSVAQAVGRYGWRVYLVRCSFAAGKDFRERLAHHLLKLSPSFFDRRRVGDLLSLATNDTDSMRLAISAVLIFLVDAIFYFITIPLAMYWMSPKLTWVALASLPLIPIIVVLFERAIQTRFTRVQEAFSRLASLAQEGLSGLKVIKAYTREPQMRRRFEKESESYRDENLEMVRVQSWFGPVLDMVMGLGMLGLIAFGGREVLAGTLSLGAFVAFQRYVQKLVWPMEAIGLTVTFYQRAVVSQRRIHEVLDQKSDVRDGAVEILSPSQTPAKSPAAIEFSNLSFRYPGTDRWVLKNLSFRVEPGESVALVGPVASGKSTILSLIPRLYPPPAGAIHIHGKDIWDWPMSWLRRDIAVVGQEVFLFSETVTQNILEGTAALPQPHLDSLIKNSALDSDVGQWAEGLETIVGEKGHKLSGGQRQRVGLARALAKPATVLLLDDIVSALDTQTAERVFESLHRDRKNRAMLFTSHRASAARRADRILVIVGGEIVEHGTHWELVTRPDGYYRRMCEEQAREEDLSQYVENLSV